MIESLIASHCSLVVLAGTPSSRVFDLTPLGKISALPLLSPEYLSIVEIYVFNVFSIDFGFLILEAVWVFNVFTLIYSPVLAS